MNERIKELAEQAREHARQYVIDCRTYGYYMEHNEEQVEFEKKFAELIVRGCTQLLFDESERLYTYSSECDNLRHSDEAELCAEKCMDNIKMIEEHFGVEE